MKLVLILSIIVLTINVAKARELECVFKNFEEYTCLIEEQDFENDFEITIDASNHGVLTPKENNDVRKVVFSESKMSHVPTAIFEVFPNLESLSLKYSNLNQWKREYLKGAGGLKKLFIIDSHIEKFEDDSFAEAPKIEFLMISNSKITAINPRIFTTFSNLVSLDFGDNDFSGNLNKDVFDSVANSLVHLNLGSTNMTRIPEGMFKTFANLKKLNIGENPDLEPIDASLTVPANLKTLIANKSKITNAPFELNIIDGA